MSARPERDPNQIAIERAHPTLTCNWVYVAENRSEVEFHVAGAAADLIRADLISQAIIDMIPPCGWTTTSRQRLKRAGIPWVNAEIRRLKDGRLGLRRGWSEHDNPQTIIEKYGLRPLAPPTQKSTCDMSMEALLIAAYRAVDDEARARFGEWVAATLKQRASTRRQRDDGIRERPLGRERRVVRWRSMSNVIWVDLRQGAHP